MTEVDYSGPVEVEMTPENPGRPARHPVEVTAQRLADHVEAYGRHLTPTDVDTLADACEVLDQLQARLDSYARRHRGA